MNSDTLLPVSAEFGTVLPSLRQLFHFSRPGLLDLTRLLLSCVRDWMTICVGCESVLLWAAGARSVPPSKNVSYHRQRDHTSTSSDQNMTFSRGLVLVATSVFLAPPKRPRGRGAPSKTPSTTSAARPSASALGVAPALGAPTLSRPGPGPGAPPARAGSSAPPPPLLPASPSKDHTGGSHTPTSASVISQQDLQPFSLRASSTPTSSLTLSSAKQVSGRNKVVEQKKLEAEISRLVVPPAPSGAMTEEKVVGARRGALDRWYTQIANMLPDIPTAVYRRLNGKPEQQNEHRRSLILDIGANAGAFTSRILQSPACRGGGHQTSKCHVLAFECVPEYARYIRESHDRRDPFVPPPDKDNEMKDDLTVVNACASEQRGKGVIYTSSDGNLGWNTQVAEQTMGHKMTKVEVEEVRVEDVVEGLGFFAPRGLGQLQDVENPEKPRIRDFDLALIKIDTEGAEYLVLRGMRGLLRRLKNQKTKMPILMVEFGWGVQSHPHAAEELEMFDWLVQELGYTPDKNYREIKKTEDIVFLPAD